MKRTKPIDFSAQNPPLAVTDPDRAEAKEAGQVVETNYPMHLVKPDLEGPGGVANRELVVAKDGADERRYRAQGYMSHQDADVAERRAQDKPAPVAGPKAAKSGKPRNPKPKAPKL